jgi:RimJ/RimL family protein N-acetyltransferase
MSNDSQFKEHVVRILSDLKHEFHKRSEELRIPIKDNGRVVGFLHPVSRHLGQEKDKYVELLTKWREENWRAYPTVFKVTGAGTEKWIQSQLIDREDRILFVIIGLDNEIVGHLGLSNFDFHRQWAEIDNVVRGVSDYVPGIMTMALKAIINWSFEELKLMGLCLRVFSDNSRAIKLYERCGFEGVKEIPLHKVVDGEVVKYEEIQEGEGLSVDRIFLLMELDKEARGS